MGVSALQGRAWARSVAFRPPLLLRRSFECSPRSCVALQALPAVRVNKLISMMLWLCVALWGRGEDPIFLLLALPMGAGSAEGWIWRKGGSLLTESLLSSFHQPLLFYSGDTPK